MRFDNLKATIMAALRVAGILPFAAALALGQQQINLTAGPATATLPDGTGVPMWGYSCGTVVTGSTATCAALNKAAAAGSGAWSPVVITVPTGQGLTINLTNNLSFANGNSLPTSLVIVGQVGGGLGGAPATTPSPDHSSAQSTVTWSTVGAAPVAGTPPAQGARVRSFGTEVPAVPPSTTPMPSTALTWTSLRPGTYLIESGTHPSIQGPMGLYGILVVTAAPTPISAGTAYPGVTYYADVPLLLSEIDPVQNNAVNAAVNTAGFSETTVWSGQPGQCGNPSSPNYQTCYPPAVNYTPLYYLFNGTAFDKTNPTASVFPATAAPHAPAATKGTVLVRLVNAGLRMHVPSIVGSQTGATTPTGGFSLIAEDGNPLPGIPRVQSEVFMAAGKTYDVAINVPSNTAATALPVYDRELSLSGNAIQRDAGMLAYISINGSKQPAAAALAAAAANPDVYKSVVPGQTFSVTDPSKGVLANDFNVYGVKVVAPPASGTVVLNANGTFTYSPTAWTSTTTDSFTYCGNGTTTGAACAVVSLGLAAIENAGGITVNPITYTSNVATYLNIKNPGILSVDSDSAGFPLTVNAASVTPSGSWTLNVDPNGGFTASVPSAGTYTFTYKAQNSQGTVSSSAATVTLNFPNPSNLQVSVVDGASKVPLAGQDYRWVIEEDKTFYVDPTKTQNNGGTSIVPTFGVNFHTSYMPYVAQGCTGPQSCEGGQMMVNASGAHVNAVCDVGDGACRPDATGNGFTPVLPSQVYLDPTKRYYISVLPGDAANPFYNASPTGHGMGGAPISFGQTSVTVLSQPSPYPPGKLSVFVFEDDFPLNGEHDGGGGVDVLAPNEPGLGGFQIHLWDAMGGNGDFTGQMTYDMFNQPLSNSLAGTVDPATGQDACPISPNSTSTFNGTGVSASGTSTPNVISVAGLTVDASQIGNTLVIKGGNGFTPGTYTITAVTPGTAANGSNPAVPGTWTLLPAIPSAVAATSTATGMTGTRTQPGITGMIVTCPKYEADGVTLSALAGQAVVANLMPGRWGVVATPAADRIAKGEEWLQTNTLDGQKAHDVFTRIGEPSYFQEYGPANFHVVVGFANPAIINARLAGVCAGTDVFLPGQGGCNNTITGKITGQRLSRTPDERLYESGNRDTYYWTQCYVSLGDPDGEDFAFTKCAADGTFTLKNIPTGSWRITTFDQWNDQIVDGLSTPVLAPGGNATVNMGNIAATQWQTNLYTKTFVDDDKTGVASSTSTGIPLIPVTVRLRDGSLENTLGTDFTGTANFNETFPLFSWYVVETDITRYKNTGTHVVYDAGGPADGTAACGATGYPPCGSSTAYNNLANTSEQVPVPSNLRVPGAVYCAAADCVGSSIATGPVVGGSSGPGGSTGRIDPPWVGVEGWQGFPGQNNFLEFGKEPYASGENGGIQGHVVYASTRPFDDPQMLVQTQWEPLVPHVTINLYQEGFAADGVTPTLTKVDTTQTSSFDDFAQGFRSDGIPNMNCPGQTTADLFFFTLYNQPNYLNSYDAAHGGPAAPSLPANSQFKCYDGMHNWNQIQPVPYDGMYKFPSVTATNPTSGKAVGTNCTICKPNAAVPATDLYYGLPMLPAGKYVVEVVLPPGYELVKEEDKNILIGDNYIAPVTQQFGGLGNVFILPDQAAVGSSYNANNAQNPTTDLGAVPRTGIVPVFPVEPVWPCVGELRTVPDYISLFPQSKQVAPFAGASRHLCDRKEVTLGDQMAATAKFYIYTSTHIASKFTGGITDDFTSEFDPFSPQFGEKFAPPNLPVALRDWTGAEIGRVYADQWGAYNGMVFSTWEVNPPNPTGYSPNMMVFCMNDPGPAPGSTTTDPLFNPGYSQFCYELPFMPGTTQYLDTPVVPTTAFSEGYNHVDCAYPTATPAISEVDGDGIGPWVSAAGKPLTIKALGDQTVTNYGYSGPSATTAPFNEKTIPRHYGFGTQCTSPTAGNGTCNTLSSVTIGGKTATITGWSDTQITVTVPTGVPPCAIQQQAQYAPGATSQQCGELLITAGNGVQSIDTVTVTIGGKAPVYVSGTTPLSQYGVGAIQTAIDKADPGDLIIVPAGTYNEMVIMWKPVRLQGVGAATTIINANAQPAGKLDPWRAKVSCLFGLATNGQPYTGGNTPSTSNANPFDPTNTYTCGGWTGFTAGPAVGNVLAGTETADPQVDRLPLEGILGWDTTVNGNLAQLLQEPTLMGAYEGSGILVLSKGVNIHGAPGYYGSGAEAAFPTGTTVLTGTASDCGSGNGSGIGAGNTRNPYPSNFQCNPSRIDGLSITDSSQGGGGIFVHAWGHNLEIANDRVYNNIGTLSGGVNIGQGESPDAYLAGTTADSDPGSCQTSNITNLQLPYCFDMHVNVHNNAVTLNTSIGDELFSGTPAGAGGVSFCTGADYYQFNYNWVCGNMSTGDGGGFSHLGFIWNGDIEHNSILFNQSLNPTIPTNGGGIIIMGAAPDGFNASGVECGGTVADADCTPGLPDGTGPGLIINANLIMGNAAESGSGGGIRFQSVNGIDIANFPNGNPSRSTTPGAPTPWNTVQVTNNVIANNVAGWDGAGVSLQDAVAVNLINNTIVSNDTTASSGVLFNTLGAPLASAPGAGNQTNSATTSAPQPAGLVSMVNSSNLTSTFTGLTITCPAGHSNCTSFSNPLLANDVFWQNRTYYIGVGALSPTYQQNIVSLYNSFTTTPAPSQPSADATTANGNGVVITGGTGACTAASYWDIGVRGDTGPGNHASGFTLAPTYSVLTNASEVGAGTNDFLATNPTVLSQYCNGARIPPEFASGGWNVPPGISDATVPNPVFNLTPVATVDEGNNWVNMQWGPLSLVNPVTLAPLGNYALAAGSPAIDAIPVSAATLPVSNVPKLSTDFFGNPRPDPGLLTAFDVGAVEFQLPPPVLTATVTGGPLAFGNIATGTTSALKTLTLQNTGTGSVTGITLAFSSPRYSRPAGAAGGTCGATLTVAAGSCTINVVFAPTATSTVNATLTITTNGTVTGSPVSLSGTGVTLPMTVTPGSLAFGNVPVSTTSAAQTLSVHNATGGTRSLSLAFTGPFSRPAGTAGGTCGANLTNTSTCTINVVFTPGTTLGAAIGTVAITTNGTFTVANSPVQLTGTGVPLVISATLAPATWSVTQTRDCPGTGILGILACSLDPTQTFTLTNTGNVPLTGIAQGALSGANSADFSVTRLLSTCGPTGNGQLSGQTTLAPGASCTVMLQFKPLTSEAAGTKTATVSVTDVAGTQSSALTGTAN